MTGLKTQSHARRRSAGRSITPTVAMVLMGCTLMAVAASARSTQGLATFAGPGSGPEADRVLRERSRPLLQDPAAALRAAQEAIDQRDRSHAIWLLGQVAHRHPIVGDHATLMQLEVLRDAEHHEATVGIARSALKRFPDSPLRPRLHELLGRALYATGQTEAAHAAWRGALDHSRDDALRSRVLLEIASAEEEQGLTLEAATTYKLIWYAHPTSAEAGFAAHRLDLIEDYLGRPLRNGTDWRRRGDRLFRSRENEAALEAFEWAKDLGLGPAETRLNERRIARSLFRLRRYPEAVEAFSRLPQTDDIPIWRARSLARAGQVFAAIDEFERLGQAGRNRHAIRARFLAGLLLDGRGRTSQAEAHYREVARSGRRSGLSDAAAWRLGWAAYRAGEYERANVYFDQLIRQKQGDPIGQLRPRYWQARSLEHLEEPSAAAAFAEIAEEFPLSYYGWRAQSRLDSASPLAEGAEPTAAPRLTPGIGQIAPAALARTRILIGAGRLEEARQEIQPLARKARGLKERIELAQLATAAEDYNRAQRIVVEPYTETLARGPVRQHEDLWWYAWPAAYSNWVDQATQGPEGVDPALVYAVMREESGYRAKVVSPVGARGLLQIMTPTGERLAASKGWEQFHAEDLFEPQLNIDLGSHYLGQLTERFGGRLSAAIASYNAGPEAVSGWPLGLEEDDDEWVESIPYDQTRSYVRRVLRSLHAYRVLY